LLPLISGQRGGSESERRIDFAFSTNPIAV
jgi:hypothetical protein